MAFDKKTKTMRRTSSAPPYHSASSTADARPKEASISAKKPTLMPPRRTWKSILLARILPLLVLIEASLLVAERIFDLPFDPTFSLRDNRPVRPDSVCVPGAGFSGFWFTLGRLQSVSNPASKSYYCYSAGCLSVVATLSDRSVEEMIDLASDVKRMWKDGEVDGYDVVTRFVDGLLSVGDNCLHEEEKRRQGDGVVGGSDALGTTTSGALPIATDAGLLLSKINVITTTPKKGVLIGARHSIRTPSSVEELRDMLVQTTWIPFATGDGLWTVDARTGDRHMDGGFTAATHPRCTHHLGLPFMMDLFLNFLNVDLSRDKVEKYWNAGVAMGL